MSSLVCEVCEEPFERPHARGPAPKYCSAAHRQVAYRSRRGTQANDSPLLTEREHHVIGLAGQLWNEICKVCTDGPGRPGDLGELIVHIHAIQHAVMAQAAAREYPDRYRLLGGNAIKEPT